MDKLEQYIENNISLVNKNKQINIIIGEKLCDGIFNAKLTKTKLEEFIKHTNKYKDTTFKFFKVYKKNNSIIKVNNNIQTQHSYRLDNHDILNIGSTHVLCGIYTILDNDDSIISIYNYDSIQDIEVYTINIDNLFIVEIENTYNSENKEYFKLTIIIKKPNKHLFNKIREILILF